MDTSTKRDSVVRFATAVRNARSKRCRPPSLQTSPGKYRGDLLDRASFSRCSTPAVSVLPRTLGRERDLLTRDQMSDRDLELAAGPLDEVVLMPVRPIRWQRGYYDLVGVKL
jgi:hypothetical protein